MLADKGRRIDVLDRFLYVCLVDNVAVLVAGLILVDIEAVDVALGLVSDRLTRHTHALSSGIVSRSTEVTIVRGVVVLIASEEEARLLKGLVL